MIPLIECQNINKNFEEKKVIEDITFSLNEGEILCIVGPSGCGKTTLLRCIAGLEHVTSGNIYLEGKKMNEMSAQERPVVMMFQHPLLFPHLTIIENTVYGLKLKNITKSERIAKGMEILENMEIGHLREAYPHEISGGQQQRVALARALLVQPKLLVLDEPFSSLDPDLRSSLRGWVKKKLKKWRTTAIFVTHDKEEAMVIADRIAVMKDGSIQQIGSPEELYESPNTAYVANYFSDGFTVDELFVPLSKVHVSTCLTTVQNNFDQCLEAKVDTTFFKGGQRFIQVELVELGIEITIACQISVSKNDMVFLGVNTEAMVSFRTD
ncbi:hypothetical protein BKP45_07875 [Anaerobacillus alkalidiazotrophicus]|uniref:Carnitine transport ATP-binding protein OpuCA n=1 Tax=Anaerobacillus alkalidiazotrophicus TaxID=472963 RepID=A0A1S2M8N0_9BACI|nr:ABC transporter ATP-binding protein [Anaerobacillus alkalidiazotrophicus]OIJ20880.1 hypothetical protein BKP45_07875 [Anaerobacillus alkalidiazotrophicus]